MQMERCANAWEKGKTRIPRNEGVRSSLKNHYEGCGLNHSGREGELQGQGCRAAGRELLHLPRSWRDQVGGG